ncbi:MAG: hypothetical protein HQK51_15165 [Oligoflexia bacterium]|nr:hypothetical protein [Oligoflexia bacterium]
MYKIYKGVLNLVTFLTLNLILIYGATTTATAFSLPSSKDHLNEVKLSLWHRGVNANQNAIKNISTNLLLNNNQKDDLLMQVLSMKLGLADNSLSALSAALARDSEDIGEKEHLPININTNTNTNTNINMNANTNAYPPELLKYLN